MVSVLDATNLERNLFLTLQILEKGLPTLVVLNMWDCAQRRGVHLNIQGLSKALGVPVITLVAVTGEGLNELSEVMEEALKNPADYTPQISPMHDDERWAFIGQLITELQKI